MDIVGLCITIIVVVAICAICAWFVRSSGLTIPQPILIAVYAVLAILAILFVAHYAGVGRLW